MRIALAQINPTVGDIGGNLSLCVEAVARAGEAGADLLVLPELALSGYPPEDLLFSKEFLKDCRAAAETLAQSSRGLTTVFGVPWLDDENKLRNAAVVAQHAEVAGLYFKRHLPTYGVFDEDRYFEPDDAGGGVFETPSGVIGISICEDIWLDDGEPKAQAEVGAKVLVNLSASPFHAGKQSERAAMLSARARSANAWLVYVNVVGGQDELVFDGTSTVWTPAGELFASAARFATDFLVVDTTGTATENLTDDFDKNEEIYEAIKLGLRDYVHKNGFQTVVLGLSGGIDSSVVAAIAADALGRDSVTGLILPSRFSSDHSREDAAQLATNLGIKSFEIPIEQVHEAFETTLSPHITNTEGEELTRENLQARIRGVVWMAYANATGALALSCGNKSEMATGYATLYGDMAAAFAPLKDVPKTTVYKLASLKRDAIPARVFEKPPSAELKPNQTDQDTLPPYDVLDEILAMYVENGMSAEAIAAQGHDLDQVRKTTAMVDRAEFKRRQAPPGVKITTKAFGRDRRMPITNRYVER